MRGDTAALQWCCTRCDAEWPAGDDDPQFTERRRGLSDRRKLPREDRRK
jgi:hypothetical protein